jgi:hypothetical protein
MPPALRPSAPRPLDTSAAPAAEGTSAITLDEPAHGASTREVESSDAVARAVALVESATFGFSGGHGTRRAPVGAQTLSKGDEEAIASAAFDRIAQRAVPRNSADDRVAEVGIGGFTAADGARRSIPRCSWSGWPNCHFAHALVEKLLPLARNVLDLRAEASK